MDQWFDFSFIENVIAMLRPELLHIFGINPIYMQFFLVFIFVMALMWVVRPIIEWIMIKGWATLSSYITSALLAIVFLQMVDRYAMTQEGSVLPMSFWPICLTAISGFGAVYTLFILCRRAWNKIIMRSKNHAA